MNELLTEFKSNQRFRVLVWAVVVILLIYFSLLLRDIQTELESDFLQVHKRVQEISSVSAQKSWLKNADESSTLKMRAESEFWSSRSEGLAQATFQTWLDQQLEGFHTKNTRIRMLPVERKEDALNLWKVSARIQADSDPSQMQRFLFRIESLDKITIVDTLKVYNDRRKAFDMVVTAWFRKVS